jgi:hypothetical protein
LFTTRLLSLAMELFWLRTMFEHDLDGFNWGDGVGWGGMAWEEIILFARFASSLC